MSIAPFLSLPPPPTKPIATKTLLQDPGGPRTEEAVMLQSNPLNFIDGEAVTQRREEPCLMSQNG